MNEKKNKTNLQRWSFQDLEMILLGTYRGIYMYSCCDKVKYGIKL